MGLPDSSGFIQNNLQLFCIVVSPYTTIVFNTPVIGAPGGFTCDNSSKSTPTTFRNGLGNPGYKTIYKITSWYVYRYTTTGAMLDNGAYFVSNSINAGIIT